MCVYIYIYIYIECRRRHLARGAVARKLVPDDHAPLREDPEQAIPIETYIYIYIYIHIYISLSTHVLYIYIYPLREDPEHAHQTLCLLLAL